VIPDVIVFCSSCFECDSDMIVFCSFCLECDSDVTVFCGISCVCDSNVVFTRLISDDGSKLLLKSC
jgi:hypothetical protein